MLRREVDACNPSTRWGRGSRLVRRIGAVYDPLDACGGADAGDGRAVARYAYSTVLIAAPTNGAVRYTQRPLVGPPAMAGARLRAGFIDAPVIGPPNIASRPTVAPIAIAASCPWARVSVATARITSIRNAVMTSSHRNAWWSLPDGVVAPRPPIRPREPRRISAAAMPPASCA